MCDTKSDKERKNCLTGKPNKYQKRKRWKVRKHVSVTFSSNYGLIWCYSNRGHEVSMCNFKEIDSGCKT